MSKDDKRKQTLGSGSVQPNIVGKKGTFECAECDTEFKETIPKEREEEHKFSDPAFSIDCPDCGCKAFQVVQTALGQEMDKQVNAARSKKQIRL